MVKKSELVPRVFLCDYFGQEEPGLTPELFITGTIDSNDHVYYWLLVSQSIYRVGSGGFYCLEADCKKGNGQDCDAGKSKQPPFNADPVCEPLQPLVHRIPGQRKGDNECHHYPYHELF